MPQLSVYGRWLLVQRVLEGRPVAHVAAGLGVSRATGYKWWRRWREEGVAGLQSRSSRPRTSPRRTSAEVEEQVLALRRERRLGPARIAGIVGLPASTVHRVLTRHGVPRLAWLDRPSGTPIRYERDEPGDLVHVDIKKLGKLRDGGGWQAHGRGSAADLAAHRARSAGQRVGHEYVHSAVDDHSRLAYCEVLPDEQAATAVAFWSRAQAFFTAHGITVRRVLTDNGACYRSHLWAAALRSAGITHKRTRPYRPQTNGKVERLNRTLLTEWAYREVFTSNQERTAALSSWLHNYNHHRAHTALEVKPPVSRVNNLPGHYS
ncbi:IS481 family transposase [Motilibacter peucedani]|nr:IS481 family transposase [Motilibacter peucedani]